MAYFENGSTNSKRALCPEFAYGFADHPRVGGALGEIFRGYYYPQSAKLSRRAPLGQREARDRLIGKIIRDMPWRDHEVGQAVTTRLDGAIAEFVQLSPDGWDILDLGYVFERVARWAGGSRTLWRLPKHMPFGGPSLIELGFRLPAPIELHCRLHRELILSTLPFTYTWKFNGGSTLADFDAERSGTAESSRASRSRARLIKRLFGRRLSKPKGAGAGSHEAARARLFADPLGAVIRDTLLARTSMSRKIFEFAHLEHMVDSHIEGRENHLRTLGFLMTIEQWQDLISETSSLAARDRARA